MGTYVRMHSPAIRQRALELIAEGINDSEVGRLLDVPRSTVRGWRAPRYQPRGAPRQLCPRCWLPSRPMAFTSADYAMLLGLYLGDGCISRLGRTYSLRITLDTKHPHIIDECDALMRRCFPSNLVYRVTKDAGSCTVVQTHSTHLPCVFPQHGPGKKHERRIQLEAWQIDAVIEAPWDLLRGLIWSDGCSFTNRTGKYAYLSWEFTNMSADIRDLFAGTCDLLGVSTASTRRSFGSTAAQSRPCLRNMSASSVDR